MSELCIRERERRGYICMLRSIHFNLRSIDNDVMIDVNKAECSEVKWLNRTGISRWAVRMWWWCATATRSRPGQGDQTMVSTVG